MNKYILSIGLLLLTSSLSFNLFIDYHYVGLGAASILVVLFLIYNAVNRYARQQNTIGISSIFLLMFAYTAWCGIRLLFDYNGQGFYQLLKLEIGLVLLLFLENIKKVDGLYKRIGWGFIIYSLIECTIVVLQLFGLLPNSESRYAIGGTMGNPNALAISLMMGIWFFPPIFFRGQPVHKKITGALLLAFILGVIILLRCRAVWVALAISAILYYKGNFIRVFRRQSLLVRLLLIITIAGSSCFAGYGIYLLKKDSTIGRLLIWKISGQLATENILIGIGPGNFANTYAQKQSAYFMDELRSDSEIRVAGSIKMAYNEFLQSVLELGVIGFLILILIIASIYRLLSKHYAIPFRKELTAMFIALAVASLFNFSIVIPVVFFQFVILIGLTTNYAPAILTFRLQGKSLAVPVFIIALLGFQTFLMVNSQYIAGRFLSIAKNQNAEKATSYFENKRPIIHSHPKALYSYGNLLIKGGRENKAISILERATTLSNRPEILLSLGKLYMKQGEYAKAEPLIKKAHYTIPGLLRPRHELAHLYLKIGRKKEAYFLAKGTVRIGTKAPSPLSTKILNNMRQIIKRYNYYEEE